MRFLILFFLVTSFGASYSKAGPANFLDFIKFRRTFENATPVTPELASLLFPAQDAQSMYVWNCTVLEGLEPGPEMWIYQGQKIAFAEKTSNLVNGLRTYRDIAMDNTPVCSDCDLPNYSIYFDGKKQLVRHFYNVWSEGLYRWSEEPSSDNDYVYLDDLDIKEFIRVTLKGDLVIESAIEYKRLLALPFLGLGPAHSYSDVIADSDKNFRVEAYFYCPREKLKLQNPSEFLRSL